MGIRGCLLLGGLHLDDLGLGRSLVGLLAAGRLLLGLHRLVHVDLEAEFLGGGLHGQGDAAAIRVDLHDLHLHIVARMHDLRRGVDVAAGHLGDVHQALDGVAQLDEGAEGHDLGDLAVNDGAHG